ncbi:MAG: hypothetical protein NT113_14050 [Hyphomicrobiales bacterium]|nr:hypothetical protein [Hyphomicrobiales bacterium]
MITGLFVYGHCEEQSDEAIHSLFMCRLDCFATLAMTAGGSARLLPKQPLNLDLQFALFRFALADAFIEIRRRCLIVPRMAERNANDIAARPHDVGRDGPSRARVGERLPIPRRHGAQDLRVARLVATVVHALKSPFVSGGLYAVPSGGEGSRYRSATLT